MEGTTYIERMSEVMPKVGERVYALIRESISSRRPVEDLLEDVREHALQSSRFLRVARNCYGERRLDLLREDLITAATAMVAEAVIVTYQEQKRHTGSTGGPAAEKKKNTRRKGVCMGKALLLTVREAAAAIGVGERTVHKWILAEKIGHKIGQDGRKKIPLAQLKKHVDADAYAQIKENLEQGLPPLEKKPVKKPAKPAKTKKPCCKACKQGAKRAGH